MSKHSTAEDSWLSAFCYIHRIILPRSVVDFIQADADSQRAAQSVWDKHEITSKDEKGSLLYSCPWNCGNVHFDDLVGSTAMSAAVESHF